MRLRMAYAKMEDAKYIAHLDLMRMFERALRRAEIPMAYTEGFNPRPKISFGFALAVGVEGEAEYVDVEIQGEPDTEEVMGRLQKQLPPGVRLLRGQALTAGAKPLMAVLDRAAYRIRLPMTLPIQPERLREAVEHWLTREQVIYSRFTKKGPADKDIRPWVKRLDGDERDGWISFDLEIEMGNAGSVRPEEVLVSLRDLEDLPLDLDRLGMKRTGVFVSGSGEKQAPFEG